MRTTDLKEIRQRSIDLTKQQETLIALESEAERVTQTFKNTPRAATPNVSMLENVVLKIMHLREQLDEMARQLQVEKLEAAYEIESRVKLQSARIILKARYLRAESWARIAKTADVSISRVMQLHRRGLSDFDRSL